MATSFNVGLNVEQVKWFQKKIQRQLRRQCLTEQLASEGAGAAIDKITDLQNTIWGHEAVLTLVPDSDGYGVVGDNRLQDREDAITSYDQRVTYERFRRAFINEGMIADRDTWIKFGTEASNQLTYWAKDMKDRLFINTISGISYEYETNGAQRSTKSEWSTARFASDVTGPSANRHFQITDTNGTIGQVDHDTLLATHTPKWGSFVSMRAALPMMRIKPIRGTWGNGSDLYIALVHPYTMAALKNDSDFQRNWRDALARGEKNPIFSGAETYLVDGILLISHPYVYNTMGAVSGSNKWGAGKNVDGSRIMFLGAQALGMVDLGTPSMKTRYDDYDNRMGISISFMFGMKKLVWRDAHSDTDEDFGCVALDVGLTPSIAGINYSR
jgi:hypothetical protein